VKFVPIVFPNLISLGMLHENVSDFFVNEIILYLGPP
jgi:hypothetical protein